jgi:hypothetical protein
VAVKESPTKNGGKGGKKKNPWETDSDESSSDDLKKVKQGSEELLQEKRRAICKLINMKAELEQEKLGNSNKDEALAKAMERDRKNVQIIVRHVTEVEQLKIALDQEKSNVKEEKAKHQAANSKLIEVRKENFVLNMEVLRLDSALEEKTMEKLKIVQEKNETILMVKDKEIRSAELLDKVPNMDTEIKQLNIALDQEKMNLNEEKAKNQALSVVIDNQEKEIKHLNIDLDHAKEEIKEIFLRIKEQNEVFWKEIKCLEMANRDKLKMLQQKDEDLAKAMDREKKNVQEIASTKHHFELTNEEILHEKGKAIFKLVNMKAELEQEKLRNAKKDEALAKAKEREKKNVQEIVRHVIEFESLKAEHLKPKAKHQAFSDVIDNQKKEIKDLNIALDQAKEEINEIFVRIEKQNEVFWTEIKQLMKMKNESEQENLKLVNEIERLKDKLEQAKYEINAQFAEITFLNNGVKRLGSELDNSLSKAKDQEKRHVQEIIKHETEIEHLKAELAREILISRWSSGINLNNLKVRVDEFNCMKDMIRNNLEVKCLNVTFDVNDS